MYFIPTKSHHNLKSTKSRHICTIETLRGMDNGNLSRSLQMEQNRFKCTITDKLHKAWYAMVLFFKAKIRIVPNCTATVENLGGLETMAPVYFFLTIDQRFPLNFNHLCLSIVRPQDIYSPKMTTTSSFCHSCIHTQ